MSKCNVCDCYVTLILVLKFSHFVMCKSSCAHFTRCFPNCTSLLGRISLQVINHFKVVGQQLQTWKPPLHRIWQRCLLGTFSKNLHGGRSSLPIFARSCSIMRDGDPFPFWLVQHPSSAAGHRTTVGMARSQVTIFTQLGCSPNQENKTGFGPLALWPSARLP